MPAGVPAAATGPSAPAAAGKPPVLALAWFPAADYPYALARWPDLTSEGAAKGAKDHADYNRALQRTLQDYKDAGLRAGRLLIAPLHLDTFLAWCAQHHRDPAQSGSRANYAAPSRSTVTRR